MLFVSLAVGSRKSRQKGLDLNFPSSKLHQTLERTASAWIGKIAGSLAEGVCNFYILEKQPY